MSKRGNGEGSIYYSESLKRWVGQVSLGYKDDGNLKRKTVYGKTRKEVNEKMTKLKNDFDKGKLVEKTKITLNEILKDFVETQYKNNIISSATYKRKLNYLEIVNNAGLGKYEIQKISAKNINAALSSISDYSNSVIHKVSQLIKMGFNQALLNNMINYNPFDVKGLILTPKSSKQDKKIDALTVEEQKLLVDELNKEYDPYSDIIKFALFTGARIGEILALDKSNIDFNNNIIHIVKTLTKDEKDKVIIGKTTKTYAGTRDIPITPLIKDIILKRYNSLNFILFSENNNLISPSTINAHFKRICKNAGIRTTTTIINKTNMKQSKLKTSNVNTHMLRHTFATRCIESGMTAVALSKLLGHSDIDTTLNTYTSVFNKFKEKEVDKYISYLNGLH